MNRRTLLTLAAAAAVVPAAARAETLAYRPGLVDERLAAGETLFLDFKASWCTTCAAQERVIRALTSENPDYAARITFIEVDWDLYESDPLTVRLNVPRRSTLIGLKADREIGRIVAGTGRREIKALLDATLAASG